MSEEKKQLTYADAGVDIDAGNKAVELMKDSVRATYRPEVIAIRGRRPVCFKQRQIQGACARQRY